MTRIITIALLLCVLAGTSAAERRKLVVVVAKSSTMTSISKMDLKHCFLGDPVSGGGKNLVPFNSEAKTAERIAFDKAILSMNADEVGRYWVDRKVRGQSSAPRSLPSMAHVVKVVAKFPGAISYVPVDKLTPEMKPLKLDGVAYTDSSYALYTE